MSDALGLVIVAATATSPSPPSLSPPSVVSSSEREPPAFEAPRDILRNDLSIAVPSIDGLRGVAVAYERWLPDHRVSLGVSAQLRESAAGDFTGITTGAGAELRWYWRPRARAWRSTQPAGSMVGWFAGGRVDVALGMTRDDIEQRWLGTACSLGTTSHVGYRLAPWRRLEVTPTAGLVWRREFDLSGRLPGWNRVSIAAGLSVGWMF